ncbi:MAG: glutamate racemase [Flavihumibacter sp.]
MPASYAPIGIFDSGYGGLTVMKDIVERLPAHDFIYLGDNARAPYGNRSFDTVYRYTWQAVEWFFDQGCPLVVLACNTASAKALRNIQQQDLPRVAPDRRVLGVIRPTTEVVGNYSLTGQLGLLATAGTVASDSYAIELEKFFPEVDLYQEACPMWVPLVENNEHLKPGADYFIKQHIDRLLARQPAIDTILLACTHYPLLEEKIMQFLPKGIRLISQGPLVAVGLADYLYRHAEMEARISKNGHLSFFTTDDPLDFQRRSAIFFGRSVSAEKIELA